MTSFVLWELRGRTGKPMTCILQSISGGPYVLQLLIGEAEIHREQFRARADALSQAAFLRKDFIEAGWTEIFRQDPP